MTAKDYPPAVYVHDPSRCEDAPPGIFYPPRAVAQAHPNARPHTCFNNETIVSGRKVTIEHVDYEPHPYEPSTITECEIGIRATRPLCKTCRGTHAEAAPPPASSALTIVQR